MHAVIPRAGGAFSSVTDTVLSGIAGAEAENLLWEALEEKSADHLETGLAFYYHINEFEDEFLLANHYSRDEIRDGLRNMLREYEIDDSIFMSELE
ncbi:MAG TPA: hypothetical protein H9955_14420 [Candidatus Mediterraneibacter cottocaccae]|nr:hypothetical protein [Candidatus Mediterraneibacter cottocaccae]